jgi:UPF0271 protein
MKTIDINSDVGERPEALADGSEEALIKLVSSASIACGGHAGDDESMERVIRLAMKHGVRIGAHPSFPDRKNFGRTEMTLPADEVRKFVAEQVGVLAAVARRCGARLSHAKPHGALYNMAVRDKTLSRAIASGVGDVDNSLSLFGLAGSQMLKVWDEEGFKTAGEAFADRVYEPNGTLRSRKFSDAIITTPELAAKQALSIARDGYVIAADGSRLSLEAQTICIHSDTPNAVEIARAVRRALEESGIHVGVW